MVSSVRIWQLIPLIAALWSIYSCTGLSNCKYVQEFAHYRGIRRVAVFVQHWPVYLQLPAQDDLGSGFIKTGTSFKGPWEAAARVDPRSLDIKDIDDAVMGSLLLDVLTKKGY